MIHPLFPTLFLLALPFTQAIIATTKLTKPTTNKYKATQVKNAISHAWHGYMDYSHLSDDLKPISRTGDKWLHSRATFYDALDTLYLAGLHNEFNSAVSEIIGESRTGKWWKPWKFWQYWHQGVPTSVIYPVKTFEYHIRVVGGLLGAYTVSGNRELLHAAQFAADCLLSSFKTPNGLPRPHTRVAHPYRTPIFYGIAKMLDAVRITFDRVVWCNTLAGLGSFGVELRVLSRETGNSKYRFIADQVHNHIYKQWKEKNNNTTSNGYQSKNWKVPQPDYLSKISKWFHIADEDESSCGDSKNRVGFGSGGDSYYEYLLKESLLEEEHLIEATTIKERQKMTRRRAANSKASPILMKLYQELTKSLHHSSSLIPNNDIQNHIARRTKDGKTTYMTDLNSKMTSHLSCFSGGLLALGTFQLHQSKKDLELAKAITEECAQSYAVSPIGLGSEEFEVNPENGHVKLKGGDHQLRPEVIESLFILWRVTKNEKWRNYGWNIFLNIEKYCKIKTGGYSGIKNVKKATPNTIEHDDYQPSFFLAETLKYLYLMFAEDESGKPLLPLGKEENQNMYCYWCSIKCI